VPHGTLTRWLEGCDCDQCREAQNDAARRASDARRNSGSRTGVRQQLLDAIYSGQSFRTVLPDLGLTSNQVWGSQRPTMNGQTSLKPTDGNPP
jgi:hypothetical protein